MSTELKGNIAPGTQSMQLLVKGSCSVPTNLQIFLQNSIWSIRVKAVDVCRGNRQYESLMTPYGIHELDV
jgi:hypothetical protein